jgi:hypothetical protein
VALKSEIRPLSFGLIAVFIAPLYAQTPVNTDFFEKEIRPILADKCYGCH